MNDETNSAKPVETPKRDSWEIKEDLRAMKRTLKIFADKPRLKDVQDLIRENKVSEKQLDAIADGDMQKALGLS